MAALAESKVLEKEEIGRYGRQLILPEWGVEGKNTILYVNCLFLSNQVN